MKDIRSEVYNALIEIMFNNQEATKEDIEEAIEWFQIHAFDKEEK